MSSNSLLEDAILSDNKFQVRKQSTQSSKKSDIIQTIIQTNNMDQSNTIELLSDKPFSSDDLNPIHDTNNNIVKSKNQENDHVNTKNNSIEDLKEIPEADRPDQNYKPLDDLAIVPPLPVLKNSNKCYSLNELKHENKDKDKLDKQWLYLV